MEKKIATAHLLNAKRYTEEHGVLRVSVALTIPITGPSFHSLRSFHSG
ncbi:MAG: hypothetical protein JJU46_01495 [Balneolaceae bacterium]|nr:hypothetical protein [Balneolaceae bacterium]